MSTTIDSLNFDFVASNVNIDGKVDAVVEMMGKIVESISKISPAKLNKIASGMTNLASGIQTLTNVDTSKLSSIADSIDRMKDVRGFNNVRKALDGTAKSAKNLSDTKVSADFFSKSNADKTIARIDKAYESALNRFKNIGKDWKFDGSIESAREYEQELIRLKDRVRSVFETDIKGKGILDKTAIANVARSIQEINSRIVKTAQYINETQTASQRIAEAKIGVPFDAVAKKAEEASKQTKTLAETLTSAFRDNVNSGKDWIPPETIKDRCRALVEMRFQMEAIASELSKLSAQGDKADANRVQMLANAYQTLRNQISNIQLPTGGLEELDVRLRSILARTQENPLLNGKLNPNIDWTILTVGENRIKAVNRATEEVAQNFAQISKFTMPQLTIGTRFTSEARELISNIQKTESALEGLRTRFEKMQSLGRGDSLGAKALKFDYDKAVEGYNKMLSKFRELQNAGRVFENIKNVMSGLDFEPVALQKGEKYTRSYAKLVSNIEGARKSLERLGEVQEKMVRFGEDYGKAWEKNQFDIDRTRAKMADYIASAHSMESAGDASVSADKTSVSLAAAKTAATKIIGAFEKMYGVVKKVFVTTITLCARAVRGFAQLTAAITGGTIKAMMKLGSVVGTVVKKMADLSGITKMFSDANLFGKIQKALKKIATLTVFMFLRTTIRNMMKSVRDGLDNIVQVSEKANAALSSFATNATYLKNSFAAMVTPLLYVVYPAIEKFVNMLAHAANMVAAFFAAITGQRTFTKAVRVQEDYAASLNKTTDAAGKLHKQLAGFDDLNNLTTSQGNDAGIPSVQDMFEEVEVPDKIKNLADKIKDILKTDDWSEIGSMIADKLNNAMAKIPWAKIEEEAQRIAKGIGTLINGFVDKLDWDLLGRTIARGINTALHFANTLLETINFEKIGQSLAKALKGLIDELDFDALGRFFANKFNWLIDIIHGFLKEMVDEWNNFGNRFGEAVDSFIRNLHLQEALESIALGLNGIADFVIGFVDNWIDEAYEWGKKIGDAVANMFSMIEWEKIGEALDKGFQFIIEIFWGFFDRMEGEWAKIGEGISQMIERAFNPETFAKAGTLIARAINAIIEVFQNLFKNKQMWENVGLSLGNFVNNIINGINWQGALNAVANFVNGFFIALDRFNSQVDWKKLADTLSSAINNLIHNVDWDAAAKTFGEFVLNLFNAIHDIVKQIDWEGIGKAIGTFLSNINWAQIIGDVFDIIWTVVSGLLKGLLSTNGGRVFVLLVALLGAIKLALKTIIPLGLIALFSAMSGSLTSGLGLLSSSFISTAGAKFGYAANVTAANYGAAATTAFGTTFAGLSAKVGTMSSGLGAALSAALSNPYVVAGIAIATFTATLIHNIDNCKKRFEQYGHGVSGWIHFFVEGLDSPLRALVDLFAPALSNHLDAFLNWKHQLIEKVFRGVQIAVHDTFRILHGFVGEMKKWGNIVGDGLKNAADGLKEFAGNVKDKIGEGLEKAGEKAKEFGDGLKEKIGEGADKARNKVKEFADKVRELFGGSQDEENQYIDPFGNQKPLSSSIFDSLKRLGDVAKTSFGAVGVAAIGAGDSATKSSKLITAAVGVVAKSLAEAGKNALSGAKTLVGNIARGIKDGVGNIGTAVGSVATTISTKLKTMADGAFEKGAEVSRRVGEGIKSAVGIVASVAVELVQKVKTTIGDIAQSVESTWSNIKDSTSTAWGAIKNGIVNALGEIKNATSTAWGAIKNGAVSAWGDIKTLLTTTWSSLKNDAGEVFGGIKAVVDNAWTGIKTFAESTWNDISLGLRTIWEGIKQGAVELFGGVKDAVKGAWDSIKAEATTIWGDILTYLTTTWDNIKNSAGSAFEGVKNFVTSAWNGIQSTTSSVWGSILSTLSNAWDTISRGAESAFGGISRIASESFATVQRVANDILTTLTSTANNAIGKAKEIVEKIANGLRNGISNISQAMGTIVDAIINSLIGAMTNAFNKAVEIASQIANGLLSGLPNVASAIGSICSTIISSLSSAAAHAASIAGSIASAIANALNNAWNIITNFTSNAGGAITNFTTNFGNNIRNGFGNAIEATKNGAGGIVSTISNAFGKAKQWGSDMVNNIAGGIKNTINKVKDAAGKVADGIKRILGHSVPEEGSLTDEMTWMPHMMQNLANGISDNMHLIYDRIRNISYSIKAELSNINASSYGSNVTRTFSSGLYQNMNGIYDATRYMRESVNNSFTNIGDAGGGAGYNIINSFRNKVYESMHYAVDAVKDLGEHIKATMANALQIHSPSRVFAEFGVMVVKGFNNGLEKMSNTTGVIIENWVDSLTDIEANVNVKANVKGLDKLSPNIGSEIDLQRSVSAQNNVTIDGSEIKNLVHAIEMMTMQDQAAMRQQTEYLEQIARKEFSIGQRDVFNAVQSEASAYEMRTGQPAFGY